MKYICELMTDLRRGKVCFSDKDKLNKTIKIDRIIEMSKLIKMIKKNQNN